MNKRFINVVRLLSVTIITSAVCMILLALWSLKNNSYNTVSMCVLALGVICLLVGTLTMIRRHVGIKHALGVISDENHEDTSRMLITFPLPLAMVHLDGSLIWFNDEFKDIFSEYDEFALFGESVKDLFPNLVWNDILKSTDSFTRIVERNGKTYRIDGNIQIDNVHHLKNDRYSVYLFLYDITEYVSIKDKFINTFPDVAYISIDNYDNVSGKVDDGEAQNPFFRLNRIITDFAKSTASILKKVGNDKYFMVFEHAGLDILKENKFKILADARELADEFKLPMSVSIGIGFGGSLIDNEAFARTALELAIGRGGDQVCVKDESQYNFFGGKSREYEKSTKLKTKATASALRDFILKSKNVVIMGHKNLDYDAFGAAVGLCVACRELGRSANIVYDSLRAIDGIIDEFNSIEEYKDTLIECEAAPSKVNHDTLVIIVDTSRPSLISAPALLELTDKVVLIDHHRRATDFIENISLQYLEAYASSTCEMVTELVQFMTSNARFTPFEAKCLYMGILMDTKNFTLKTVVRTFEAASYLRACGLDTVAVKKLFRIPKNDYVIKSKIVSDAKLVTYNTAVSLYNRKEENIRVISAQAADEMLTLDDVEAAFVIYPIENGMTGISGRSLGEVNIQLILEKLGGGGHQSIAGAQLNMTLTEAETELCNAIEEYQNEEA